MTDRREDKKLSKSLPFEPKGLPFGRALADEIML